MLEVPAGMRDVPGEPPEETARRELREEAGFDAENLALLTVIHPSAGVTDATTHIRRHRPACCDPRSAGPGGRGDDGGTAADGGGRRTRARRHHHRREDGGGLLFAEKYLGRE